MTRELVSIVMRVRDPYPQYLRKSIESALSQTYDDIELIVVFDLCGGHNDKLASAVLEEFSDDHRLKVISRVNIGGRAASMNAGLLNSGGDLIAVLDYDDYWLPVKLSEQIEHLHSKNATLLGTWAYAVDENENPLGLFHPPSHPSDVRRSLLVHDPFWHSTIMFRREVLERVGLYKSEFDGAEDYEFYLRALSGGHLACNIPKFLVYYRVRPGSSSRQSRWRKDRQAYLKAKMNAVMRLEYTTARDIFFSTLSPISFLVSPDQALTVLSILGWYERMNKFNMRQQWILAEPLAKEGK